MPTPDHVLHIRHNLTVGGQDVNDYLREFAIGGERDQVVVPETAGKRETALAGTDRYSITITYLQNQKSANTLTAMFWDALGDPDGTLEFAGTFEDGPVSETNPLWTVAALVTGFGIGGQQSQFGEDTQTFPCIDRPSRVTTPPEPPES